jgi:hypothetical protein
MNLVDRIAASMRWALGRYGRAQTYTVLNGPQAELTAYVRGVRSEDLFAGAAQQDVACVIDAAEFRIAFPTRRAPQRLDRLLIDGATWAVEEWRGAPNDAQPVFFKLLLRGGRQ